MSKQQKKQITKKILEDLYLNQKLSQRKCAEILNVSHGSISWLFKKHKIKSRNQLNGLLSYKNPQGKKSSGWKGGKIKVKCDSCNKEIELFPCQVKSKNYCNKQCKSKLSDLTGQKFGLLTVIKKVKNNKYGQPQWLCKCDCGNEKIILGSSLKSGNTKSCGCKQRLKGSKNHNWKPKVITKCAYCGKEKERQESHVNTSKYHFCNLKCYGKWLKKSGARVGENNPKWKGGGEFAPYDTYANQISFAEKTRISPKNKMALEVRCAYCNKWFAPSVTQVRSRIEALNGSRNGINAEHRFYDSNGCKQACPIYKKQKWPKGFKKATSREVDPSLRQLCFERDDWACQICGSTENLHCHHIEGYTQNKMIANDLPNVTTLCKKCHKEVHKLPGCHYHELRCDTKQNKEVA